MRFIPKKIKTQVQIDTERLIQLGRVMASNAKEAASIERQARNLQQKYTRLAEKGLRDAREYQEIRQRNGLEEDTGAVATIALMEGIINASNINELEV